jgi:hypothetical protein
MVRICSHASRPYVQKRISSRRLKMHPGWSSGGPLIRLYCRAQRCSRSETGAAGPVMLPMWLGPSPVNAVTSIPGTRPGLIPM